jgi:hypothetical protein
MLEDFLEPWKATLLAYMVGQEYQRINTYQEQSSTSD